MPTVVRVAKDSTRRPSHRTRNGLGQRAAVQNRSAGRVFKIVRSRTTAATDRQNDVVDGREAVTFLVRVKEGLEDPARVVLDL